MKKTVLITAFLITALWSGTGIQPYLLIGESGKTVEKTTSLLIQSFFFSDVEIEIIGQYHPADNPDQLVLVVTNSTLEKAIARCKPEAAYLGGIRIAITAKGDDMTYISIQNPPYWANAYLQDDYDKVAKDIEKFTRELKYAMPKLRMRIDLGYGSNQDFTAQDLREYRFGSRMPYFEDAVFLGEFDSHEQAVSTIEKNLESSKVCSFVFRNDIEGTTMTLFGVGLTGEKGEAAFVPVLDTGERRHTAFLPYEILVTDKKVYMLPAKYRIPLSFPDMKKSVLRKIKSTPKYIEESMRTLVVQ